MPDTPRNQAAYPQSASQKPGLGFPIARVLVVFNPAVWRLDRPSCSAPRSLLNKSRTQFANAYEGVYSMS
jgi:hypothetical protein